MHPRPARVVGRGRLLRANLIGRPLLQPAETAMPGFALQHDSSEPLNHARSAFQRALSLTSHLESYQQRILDVAPHCLLGWSAYPEYPLRSLEMAEAVILLDGVIYDPSSEALFAQAQQIDREPDRCERMAAWLGEWLPGCDAECVIVYLERRADGGKSPGDGTVHS